MGLELEITKLTELWYRLVNLDHHKDRDCHWYINRINSRVWSYGEQPENKKPYYSVEHDGYVFEEVEEIFKSYNEAESFLLEKIKEAIKKEENHANEVLKNSQDWHKFDIEAAKEKIKLIKNANYK